ncbi:MAG: hypothetical protein KA125_15535 [Chromatiaceae bacterium]|nr:hypothetical protein [Chromatiaceae bacterium]
MKSRRLILAIALVVFQFLLGAHELDHLTQGESDPCVICMIGAAPALLSVVPTPPAPSLAWRTPVPSAIADSPIIRPQRAPVARAPPA